MLVPEIQKNEVKLLQEVHSIMEAQNNKPSNSKQQRWLSYKPNEQYEHINTIIFKTASLANKCIDDKWLQLKQGVVAKARVNIPLTKQENYIFSNMNNPPKVNWQSILEHLLTTH